MSFMNPMTLKVLMRFAQLMVRVSCSLKKLLFNNAVDSQLNETVNHGRVQ